MGFQTYYRQAGAIVQRTPLRGISNAEKYYLSSVGINPYICLVGLYGGAGHGVRWSEEQYSRLDGWEDSVAGANGGSWIDGGWMFTCQTELAEEFRVQGFRKGQPFLSLKFRAGSAKKLHNQTVNFRDFQLQGPLMYVEFRNKRHDRK